MIIPIIKVQARKLRYIIDFLKFYAYNEFCNQVRRPLGRVMSRFREFFKRDYELAILVSSKVLDTNRETVVSKVHRTLQNK